MTREITPETRRLCAAYRRLMEIGGDVTSFVGEWAGMLGVQRPAIWRRLRSGGVIEPYQSRQEGGKGRPLGGGVSGYSERRRETAAIRRARRTEALPPTVNRDPCPRCGVRADIGCKHTPCSGISGALFG